MSTRAYSCREVQLGIRFYREMLGDERRVTAFREALFEAVRPGETVVEVGSGVGTYGFFALQAGARKVYGIDRDPVTEVAKGVARANGFEDRAVFIKEVSDKVTLPERADLLVTEDFHPLVLGPYLESLVIDARERFLKPAGRIMPISLEVLLAPMTAPTLYRSIEATPSRPGRRFGIDFSPLGELAVNKLHSCNLKARNVLAEPESLFSFRLAALRKEDLALDRTLAFRMQSDGTLHGLSGWFDARLSKRVRVSTGPFEPITTWGRSFIPLQSPVRVRKGDTLEVRMRSNRWGSKTLWAWDTKPFSGSGVRRARSPRAAFSQSTFKGFPFLRETFEKRSPRHAPKLTREGEAARYVLQRMDGRRSLEQIGRELCQKYPEVCDDPETAFQKVLDLTGDLLE
ncbi:MAG: 50S ribosomal protein L11 methyltransferase [Nitrospinota bacterium]|nr:50S ribosomal protein L11 methyltransferase [Nitrospinota bacterium]